MSQQERVSRHFLPHCVAEPLNYFKSAFNNNAKGLRLYVRQPAGKNRITAYSHGPDSAISPDLDLWILKYIGSVTSKCPVSQTHHELGIRGTCSLQGGFDQRHKRRVTHHPVGAIDGLSSDRQTPHCARFYPCSLILSAFGDGFMYPFIDFGNVLAVDLLV